MKRSLSFFETVWAWRNKKGKYVFGQGFIWTGIVCSNSWRSSLGSTSLPVITAYTHISHCFLESVLVKSFSCCWKISVRSPGKFGITRKRTVKSRSLPPLRAGFVGRLACLHQMHQGDQGNNSSHLKNMFPGLEDRKGLVQWWGWGWWWWLWQRVRLWSGSKWNTV